MTNKETIEKVTDKLIARMESGNLSWNKPWKAGALPQNYASKHVYTGWNMFVTLFSGFSSPYYLTFDQVKKLGGTVKKGEKGLPIIFWKKFTKEVINEKGEKETKRFFIAKDWTVFNAEQIEGIEFKDIELNNIGTCQELELAIQNMPTPVKIKHTLTTDQAYYTPTFDYVSMPDKGLFKSEAEYYSVLVHEVIHSTGHHSRLNRFSAQKMEFDSYKHRYSYEELVAELGAAYLSAMYGVSNEQSEKNSAAYLQGWLKMFKQDKQMLYKAAQDAQKAVNYILNKQTNYNDTDKDE